MGIFSTDRPECEIPQEVVDRFFENWAHYQGKHDIVFLRHIGETILFVVRQSPRIEKVLNDRGYSTIWLLPLYVEKLAKPQVTEEKIVSDGKKSGTTKTFTDYKRAPSYVSEVAMVLIEEFKKMGGSKSQTKVQQTKSKPKR